MKLKLALVCVIGMLLLVGGIAAQDPNTKHFAKDGLSFDYSNGWMIDDKSNSDAQDISLGRSDSEALIKIYVHRGKVDTPEKMAQAKTKLIDPYVTYTEKQLTATGAKPERVPANTEIGGVAAEGIRLQMRDSDPGEAAIFWATVGNRLVVLTFYGSDKALKKATPTWDGIRNSLKIETPPPKGAASPSPLPKNTP
jgi:hypothetical protein